MADHHDSTMTSFWLLLSMLLVCLDLTWAQGKSVPVFTDISALDKRFLPESIRTGQYIGRIVAVDPDNTAIRYSIESDGGEYFSLDPSNGTVILKKNLDYENQNEIKSKLVAIDQDGQKAEVECTSYVNDVNDNNPAFTDNAIFRSVREDAPIGFIVTPITVNDIDIRNSPISVTCDINNPSFTDACTTFILTVTQYSNTFWIGNLVLNKTLDYEVRLSYNIRLIANDGDPSHNVNTEVHVEVADVNDTPPSFDYAGPKTVPEEESIGTSIQQVHATDGDSSVPRPIYYELCGNNTDLFKINSSTGVISNAVRLDYDNTTHEKGVPYDICIMAREVINATSGQLGNDSTSTATISLKVTLQDINDNRPMFSQKSYVASVYENTVSGANIPGLQMTVTDIDSGTFNTFDLVILNNTDVFGIVPAKDQASSSVTLVVKNGTKLDYEKGPKQYIIDVEARQNFQDALQMWTGSTTVTINVLDVNDVTPSFANSSYNATVSETALPNTLVIYMRAEDPEEGNYGKAGIRYKLYGDNVPPNFQIDESTGAVTVASCSTPGVSPCIDYERKKDYSLTVSATDNLGLPGSRTRSVQLFINVVDENDNSPKIDKNYIRYINEGQTQPINPLLIQPSDPDTVGGPLRFNISGDGSAAFWMITSMIDSTTGRQYGNVTAKIPIKYTDAKFPDGEFNFAVTVADQNNSTYANVKIFVIDINNNRPEFEPRDFRATISETTKGDVFVTKVTASDYDAPTTGNGVIDFYIQSGAKGKFTVANVTQTGNGTATKFTADIFTTKDATFNYETQNRYIMILVARDRGSPQSLSGNATLTVLIEDANNKDPSIQPSFQSVNVHENEPVGKSVYKVTASDPDVDSNLVYYMTATQATDGAGAVVDAAIYDYTKLFTIDYNTGNVLVNSPLDKDKATRITYNLTVNDITPNPIQAGYGTFLIHILEFNDKAPYFDLPFYNITIDEELNNNTFVLNINCRDADNRIAGYTLRQIIPPSPLFFSLLSDSGSMVVASQIDYEQVEVIKLTVQCTDAGQPPLSNTTDVTVNIRNINDNAPVFNQSQYLATVKENTAGVYLLTVLATDRDKGDYGVVRYSLLDTSGYFAIDNITGAITILPNAKLDREKETFIKFQAVAYDSPMDAVVRKSSVVPVYITIADVNDNCPMFNKASYDVKVPESFRTGGTIADIIVSDSDEGINGLIVVSVRNATDNSTGTSNLFGITESSELRHIYTKDSLKGKMGFYKLIISATDMNGSLAGCTNETVVDIEVQLSDNTAPQWIRPSNPSTVIHVLESQYKGMVVYSSRAEDTDAGANGKIDYYFSITDNQLVSETAEFKINIVTGVISAEVEFDREQTNIYYLNLVARDNARPPASSETTLTVVILDVNDNVPSFPMKDGVVQRKELPPLKDNTIIPDDGKVLLGTCNATDADSNTQTNRIYYQLVASSNRVSDYIYVENTTCNIYLIRKLTYATTPVLEFQIQAYNEKYDDSVRRTKREVSPSILPVILTIQNSYENPPEFVEKNYLACVSVDAPFQQNIVQVTALDKDAGDIAGITYFLNETLAFQIDKDLGIISNVISFHESSNGQTTFRFRAFATDGRNNASTTVTIFVTSSSDTAWLKVNRPVNDVLPFKPQIAKNLVDLSNGDIQYACINDVKNYVDEDNQQSLAASNVLVSAFRIVDGQYIPLQASDLVSYVDRLKQDNPSALNSIYVSSAKVEEDKDSSILKEDAVLAVFIICILLIFLALLLLCIACLCIRNSNKKKKRKIIATGHTAPPRANKEIETSENPMYKISGSGFVDDVEYSTVKKVHPHATPIHPVIVPTTFHPLEADNFVPVEPPRAYLDEPEEPYEPDEPVFVAYIDPEPAVKHYPEPAVKHYPEPDEPVFVAYIDPEPKREFSPEPTHVLSRHLEPEQNPYNHVDDLRVSFPDEDEMDASIRDSPPPSLPSSYRGSPLPSPPLSSRHSDSH